MSWFLVSREYYRLPHLFFPLVGQSKILSNLSLSYFISKVSRLNLLQVLNASIFALAVLILIIPAFRSFFMF